MKKLGFMSLLAVGLATPLWAGVNYYSLLYSASYTQIDDFAPTADPVCYLTAAIGATAAGDLLAADLVTPTSGTLSFYDASYGAGTYFLAYTGPYSSTSALTTAQPVGNYDFAVTSGNALGSGTLVPKADDFCNEIPYLTNLSGLQMMPSNMDATLTWNAYTHSGTEPNASTELYVVDYTKAVGLPAFYGDLNSTGTVLAAADVKSGHTYGYTLNFRTWEQIENAGFGGVAAAYHDYSRSTGALIHCAADPGTVAGKLTLNGYYYPLGQPVTVQVYDSANILLDEQTINLGFEGYYAFDTTATGVVTVAFKNPRFLRQAFENVDLSVGQDFIHPSLINGDVDNDNVVSVFDYIILSDAFDTTPADALWDARADLDGDGVVSVFDYILLSDSFDQQGWEPS